MLIITLVFIAMLAVAVLCAMRLLRPAKAQARAKVAAEASPMKATLERRLREGADFRF